MTKRFTLSQNGTLHTVRDNVENKPLGVFEFKDNEFPAYACFHMIIDLMNNLSDENENLKSENEDMRRLINNISHQRDEFHHGARENANRVGKLKKENNSLKLLVENWEALDEEKDKQLDKQNQAIKKLKEENEQLKSKLEKSKKAHSNCDKLWWELHDEKEQLEKENEQLKIRNKGKQAFINKQDKIIKLLYNQCKDFKEILDDSNITYPIDEKLNKFFEEGVKL